MTREERYRRLEAATTDDMHNYTMCVMALRNRYRNKDGTLVLSTRGIPSKFSQLEDLAWNKYVLKVRNY